MNRLIEKTVFSGLVTACRFATWPTSRSPSLVNADDGRRRPRALLIHDDGRLAAFHDRHDRVRRAQVDSDDFVWHFFHPPLWRPLVRPDEDKYTRDMSARQASYMSH